MESMKYLVIMSDNRPLTNSFWHADYNSLVVAANTEYCKKHNYDFLYLKPFLKDKNTVVLNNCLDPHSLAPRHAAWSKVLSLHYAVNEQLSLSNFGLTIKLLLIAHCPINMLDTPLLLKLICEIVESNL